MVKQHNNLHCIAVCQSQAKFGRFAASQWEYNRNTKPYSSNKKMDSSKFPFQTHTTSSGASLMDIDGSRLWDDSPFKLPFRMRLVKVAKVYPYKVRCSKVLSEQSASLNAFITSGCFHSQNMKLSHETYLVFVCLGYTLASLVFA